MESVPTKQLIKTAFGTAPIMGLMLITPVFILTNGLHHFNFFVLWTGVTCAITFAWMFHIALLTFIKQQWAKTWKRLILISGLMYGVSFIVFSIVDPQLKIDRLNVEIIRLINILAVNTIIFVLSDLILTKENKNKFALENAKLKLANLEAEYKLLKDQINPHFLFNALSTAKALIKKQPVLAEEYIIRLSEFLRASINNNRKTISLKEELTLCNEYVALNKIRFGEALKYKTNVTVDMENYAVPYFSILSLIENAIKHNTFTTEAPLNITVSTFDNYLEVTNNRQVKFVLEDSPKTGLKNLNDRYKLLNIGEIVVKETDSEFSVKITMIKK
ncbi:MAG: histidine kinase [Bacteroidia bacterium]|nr:histidine kinase [Bacteroidia bacterium]